MAKKTAFTKTPDKVMTPAYVLPDDVVTQDIPVSEIRIDNVVLRDPTFEMSARAALWQMENNGGMKDFIPVVFPRADGRYVFICLRARS